MRHIYQKCKRCNGTGVRHFDTYVDGEIVHNDQECPTCSGTGQRSVAGLHEDLVDMLQDMNDKINDILEKVNE